MSRSALVTGAAQGIGRAIALRLARDGLNVAVNDIDSNSTALEETRKKIEKLGQKSLTLIADVSNEKAVETMMKNTARQLGSLDVVVANAGICHMKLLIDTTAEDWNKLIDVNLRGTFLCYKEAAKVMIEQGKGGKIIGAASLAAYRIFPLTSNYTASKWGVRGLTQTAALELAAHRINVNAYCPGYVKTEMMEIGLRQMSEHFQTPTEDFIKDVTEKNPFGRMAEPDDIAKLVSFLASSESDYITGQSIIIDGGSSLT